MHHGEVFGLLGPNGSGKTTTVNMVTGLVLPSAGVVTVEFMRPAASFLASDSAFAHRSKVVASVVWPRKSSTTRGGTQLA